MKILFVIDLQKQFKDKFWEYEKCIDYIKSHKHEYFVVATLFKNFDDSMFERHLNRSDSKDSEISDLEFPYDYCLDKTWYSANKDWKLFDFIQKNCSWDDEYFVMGCESDACVLATLFDLWDNNIDFKVLSEYIYTNNSKISRDTVLNLLKRNFWDCII